MVGGCVFAVGLVGHDGMIGNRVLTRSFDLAQKKPTETALSLQDAFLLVVYIEQIQLSRATRKLAAI